MKKSITLAAAAAVAVATIPSAQAAPIGYENASGFWIENTLNVSPFVDLSFSHDDNPTPRANIRSGRSRECIRLICPQMKGR